MEDTIYKQALSVAIEASEQAGKRILQGFEEALDITVKSDPADRVTQVDTDCQQLIVDTIVAEFPDHGFLGEEALTRKGSDDGSRYRWVIDPLDGTSNFIQGLPHCGTSIALEKDTEVILGVLHFPVLQTTYTAVKGQGAFCNNKSIAVRLCDDLPKAVLAECFSDRQHRGTQVTMPPCLAYRRFGSAIASLAYLASGNIDATGLRCCWWDIAAASVVIQEAGGVIQWKYDDPTNDRSILTCAAASPKIITSVQHIAARNFLGEKNW